MHKQTESAEQDQTARMCRLILLYTLRKKKKIYGYEGQAKRVKSLSKGGLFRWLLGAHECFIILERGCRAYRSEKKLKKKRYYLNGTLRSNRNTETKISSNAARLEEVYLRDLISW